MAPKSSKRGGSRKLSLKKSTVRDLKAPGRGAKGVKGGYSYVVASLGKPASLVSTSTGGSASGYRDTMRQCIRSA